MRTERIMNKNFVLYVMNDTHYVSKRAWEVGGAIEGREKGDCVNIRFTPEILNTFFDKIIKDEQSDAVLIVGDLVNMGDKVSHEDFRNELYRMKEAGKRVFVTWATHDYNGEGRDENNWNHAVYYKPDCTEPAEGFYKDELAQYYKDFGISEADYVHEATGSYSVKLCDGLRLVAIIDNGNGRSHCGLFEDGNKWLREVLSKAKESGEAVYCCVHHPVLPPWPIYQRAVDFEMYGGYKELREILCEYGVKIIFTGHTHVHGIRRFDSSNGGHFFDVATAALVAAHGQMRRVEYDGETRECRISSVGTDTLKNVDTEGLSAQEFLYAINFTGALEKAFPYATRADWEKFVKISRGAPAAGFLKKNKALTIWLAKKSGVATMRLPAGIAGKYAGLDAEEKYEAKQTLIAEVAFTIMRHIFRGNAPYTPDTMEYKVLMGLGYRFEAVCKGLHIDSYKLMKELTAEELLAPFLSSAARTGDDDNLSVPL